MVAADCRRVEISGSWRGSVLNQDDRKSGLLESTH